MNNLGGVQINPLPTLLHTDVAKEIRPLCLVTGHPCGRGAVYADTASLKWGGLPPKEQHCEDNHELPAPSSQRHCWGCASRYSEGSSGVDTACPPSSFSQILTMVFFVPELALILI